MLLSPQKKLLLLDTWMRSGLPTRDFGTRGNISRHTLHAWEKRFEEQGPAGPVEKPRGGPNASRVPELTKRTILMLKQAHPDWDCQRIIAHCRAPSTELLLTKTNDTFRPSQTGCFSIRPLWPHLTAR